MVHYQTLPPGYTSSNETQWQYNSPTRFCISHGFVIPLKSQAVINMLRNIALFSGLLVSNEWVFIAVENV